ncbi:MAG: AAA family ATPase [Crocosphaera sp.]|nr:AAA family ATPase [Crocosphaera sp.]
MSAKPLQKILFGSPGTGKSYKIREIAKEKLNIEFDENSKILKNTVKTVFHPEYTYADFMGKLLPLSQGNNVIYKYYPGHFLRALGMAYRGLIDGKDDEHYLLVIDELNRGNAPAIFGTVFQLLDRQDDNWSTYEVDISEMELIGLFDAMGYPAKIQEDGDIKIDGKMLNGFYETYTKNLEVSKNEEGLRVLGLLKDPRNPKIKIPSNLSILATINTSDESIYYLDSAFKRRWDWEYIEMPTNKFYLHHIPREIENSILFFAREEVDLGWCECIIGINDFIKENYQTIRRIEDKQIGWWFIKPEDNSISEEKVENKLMFYLWDNVFTRDKRPLENLLQKITENPNIRLITYADFTSYTVELMKYFYERGLEFYDPIPS